METAGKLNPTRIATKWAVFSVITSIILTYVIQYLSLETNTGVKLIGTLTFILFLFLTQKEVRDKQGYLTFGEGFSAGLRYAIFTGLLMAVFMFIYLNFLNPDMLAKSVEAQRDALEAKGLSDGDIEKAIGLTKKYGPLMGAFSVAVGDAVIGLVISLIVAAILKKDPAPVDYDDATYTDPTV